MKRSVLLFGLVLLLVAGVALQGCGTTYPARNPVGELLPTVTGASLKGDEVRLPDEVAGGPAVLLLGYVQDAQFDADRWLFGLLQSRTPVRLFEIPTLPGWVPRMIAGRIDSGMRSGIPEEDWASVVTVYGDDAASLVRFTGNETPRNIRVLLLDAQGKVRWFHDRGFSAGKLLELDQLVRGGL